MSGDRPLDTIAVIGGTGALGSALARRICRAGYPVCIGSRAEDRARDAAAAIAEDIPDARVEGRENRQAAAIGDIVILTVPFDTQLATLTAIEGALAGKLLSTRRCRSCRRKWPAFNCPKKGRRRSAPRLCLAMRSKSSRPSTTFRRGVSPEMAGSTAMCSCSETSARRGIGRWRLSRIWACVAGTADRSPTRRRPRR